MEKNSGDGIVNESLVRAFICLPLPEELKKSIGAWIAVAKAENSGLKWVGDHQYHITLKFCGDLAPERLKTVTEKVGQKLEAAPPGKIRLVPAPPGAFPNPGRARVLFLGVGGETEKLNQLAALIESAAVEAGLPKEARPFHPHITLARTRRPEPVKILPFEGDKAPAWTAETVLLMRSELRPQGPIYTELKQWPLCPLRHPDLCHPERAKRGGICP